MKKLYFLLWLLCALCFVACSNFQLAGGDMGVVSLSIGDNLAREIRSAASLRSALVEATHLQLVFEVIIPIHKR